MGSFKSLMTMIPGMNQLPADFDMSGKEFNRMEAMILSMTEAERDGLKELEPSRRRRIAAGSGTTIDDVNRMVKGFKRLKQLFKQMPKMQKMMKKSGGMGSLFDSLSGK